LPDLDSGPSNRPSRYRVANETANFDRWWSLSGTTQYSTNDH